MGAGTRERRPWNEARVRSLLLPNYKRHYVYMHAHNYRKDATCYCVGIIGAGQNPNWHADWLGNSDTHFAVQVLSTLCLPLFLQFLLGMVQREPEEGLHLPLLHPV